MVDYLSLLAAYPYADLRRYAGTDASIKINNDEVSISAGRFYGISARVLANGSWGFASSNDATCRVDELLERAHRLALLERGTIKLDDKRVEKKKITIPFNTIPVEEKVTSLLDAKKEISGPHVIGSTISCTDTVVTKEFYSSEGSEITQHLSYTYVSYSVVAKNEKTLQRGYETAASLHGFSKIDPHALARTADEKAERLLEALPPVNGRFTVVLDPEMTGVFSHEAVGHASEADSVVDRESILSGRLNERLGSELVTIVDDPTADDFGHYVYDDEGVRAAKTPIVEGGKLVNYLNSRETSARLGILANGHARADGFEQVPIVRMSNTYFMPGSTKKEDLFDIRYGVYLKGMKGGSVDIFSGGFMFKAEEAYEIKNGELGNLLRDVTLSGNILETLNGVELVGTDFGTSPGICGKFGQRAPVSDGGPHIRVKDMMVG